MPTTPGESPPRQPADPPVDARRLYDGALHPDALVEVLRHPDRVFRSTIVPRSAEVRALPRAARALDDVRIDTPARRYDLADYLSLNRVAGLLVLKDGAIALEDYELGLRAHDRWASFSVAKSVSSTLVGIALAQGHLHGLDDPLTRYLPALAGGGYDGVTIRQVLLMASGVAWNETYTDPDSNRRALLDLQIAARPDAILGYLATLPRRAEPGSVWNYSTGETFVVGALLEAATGRPLARYLAETVWAVAGMEGDATWWVQAPDGAGCGGSGLGVTLRDYGRFGLYCLEEGRIDGRSLVPDGWFAQATRAHAIGGRRVDYGYSWWPLPPGDPLHDGAYAAQGIFGQRVYVNPRERLVVVALCARSKPSDSAVIDDGAFFAAVARALA